MLGGLLVVLLALWAQRAYGFDHEFRWHATQTPEWDLAMYEAASYFVCDEADTSRDCIWIVDVRLIRPTATGWEFAGSADVPYHEPQRQWRAFVSASAVLLPQNEWADVSMVIRSLGPVRQVGSCEDFARGDGIVGGSDFGALLASDYVFQEWSLFLGFFGPGGCE